MKSKKQAEKKPALICAKCCCFRGGAVLDVLEEGRIQPVDQPVEPARHGAENDDGTGDGEHFAQVPRMTPSVLNSTAGATTALAKPVMGTRVPAPANFAMSS